MQNSQHSYNKNYNIIQKKYHKSSLHLARHAGQFETLENISKRERNESSDILRFERCKSTKHVDFAKSFQTSIDL